MDLDVLRSLGFAPRRFTSVIDKLQSYLAESKAPGFVLGLVRPEQPVWWYECGYADIATRTPMTRNSLLRIASLTKPMIALLLLKLVEQKYCLLSDPVSRYLPEIEQARVYNTTINNSNSFDTQTESMTLHQLLTHTAGLGYDFNVPEPLRAHYQVKDLFNRNDNTAVLTQKLLKLPLLFQPGQGWCYGLSTDFLGCVIERIAAKSLDTLCRELLFNPLDMPNTGFTLPIENKSRLATLYSATNNGQLRVHEADTDAKFDSLNKMFSAGGGLLSTAVDYAHFVQMLLNEGSYCGTPVINKALFAEMTRNQLPPSFMPYQIGKNNRYDTEGYGFGYNLKILVNPRIKSYLVGEGEYGWAGATNNYFWIEPKREVGFLLFTHLVPFAVYPFEPELKKLLYGAMTI